MKFNQLGYFAWQTARMYVQPGYRVPLSVHIVLTNRCNNRCVYCRVYKLPQEDVWTTESLKNALREMKECGTRRIHFTGGEPMLRADLGELITYAKTLGIFVSMATNGYQVQRRINELRDVGVVFLSYDGPPKVHARLRGEHNVNDVESALKALKSAGIPVWTSTVLTRWNADSVEEIVDFARRHHILANFDRLEFFPEPPCHLHPLIKEVEELVLRGNERKKVFQKLIQLKLSDAPIGSSLEYLKNGLEWPYDDRITDSSPSSRFQCWAGRANGHLETDGLLYPCGWAVGRMPGRSVLEEGFRAAWKRLSPLENCQSCSHSCMVENNLLFSLNISSILNWLVQLRK